MRAAAAYLRVSTHAQDWKLQRDAIARACKARGDRITSALWFEEKKSGRSIDRPALKKLRAAVSAGRVGRVYIFQLSRLTRSGVRDTFQVVDEFRRNGAELVSVGDGLDFPIGPMGDLALAVLAVAAQIDYQGTLEKMRAARVRIEAAGGRWGRPRAMDPGTIDRARKLRKTKSLRAVAVALKVPRSTLADALAGKGHYAKRHVQMRRVRKQDRAMPAGGDRRPKRRR